MVFVIKHYDEYNTMKLTFSKKGHVTNHKLALPKYSLIHKIGRDFVVDWLMMISLAVIVSSSLVVVGYIKYVSSDEIIKMDNVVQPTSVGVRFDDVRLDKAIDSYNAKMKVRESINSGEYKIIDPAL